MSTQLIVIVSLSHYRYKYHIFFIRIKQNELITWVTQFHLILTLLYQPATNFWSNLLTTFLLGYIVLLSSSPPTWALDEEKISIAANVPITVQHGNNHSRAFYEVFTNLPISTHVLIRFCFRNNANVVVPPTAVAAPRKEPHENIARIAKRYLDDNMQQAWINPRLISMVSEYKCNDYARTCAYYPPNAHTWGGGVLALSGPANKLVCGQTSAMGKFRD